MTRRLMPFLFLLYIVNYIDRNNIGFAGLQMTGELHFSDAAFGLGSGIFFIGYVLLGIPGAMIVKKWGARKIMAATMIAWGCVASATGLIHTVTQFYLMRFGLGVAEAAFLPGILTYLGHWHRATDRAKAVAMFMAAIPVSQVIAAPLSGALMRVHWLDLAGWRWLLILEGAPAVLCGFLAWIFLTDRPWQARWLARDEREWLTEQLRLEGSRKQPAHQNAVTYGLAQPRHPAPVPGLFRRHYGQLRRQSVDAQDAPETGQLERQRNLLTGRDSGGSGSARHAPKRLAFGSHRRAALAHCLAAPCGGAGTGRGGAAGGRVAGSARALRNRSERHRGGVPSSVGHPHQLSRPCRGGRQHRPDQFARQPWRIRRTVCHRVGEHAYRQLCRRSAGGRRIDIFVGAVVLLVRARAGFDGRAK